MEGFQILIPLAPFLMVAAIVVIPAWLKSRERREMQTTLRTAIEKGQALPPEVIDAMTKNVKTPSTSLSDMRTGVIWIAVGLGVAAFGFMIGYIDSDAFRPIAGIAAIPVIIGAAYVVLSFFNPNKHKPD